MNKKLLAVAVAGALAAPGVAFAQASSVTISGIFKVGVEALSYSSSSSVTPRLNTSQMRVVDNSSQIWFNVAEDLGNGLSAIAKLDVRFAPDAGSLSGSGNTWVGLKSNSLGQLTFGRWDLHYGKQPDDTAAKAGALGAAAISLMDFIGDQAIANATRTPNTVRYDMPTFNGLNATIAWSANPFSANEADMRAYASAAALAAATTTATATTTNRKGDAWNINPSYTNGPFQVGYSYWRAKADNPGAAVAATATTTMSNTYDQRGDSLYGYYKFGGFKIGLGWNKSSLEQAFSTAAISGGTKIAQRTAWSLPMSYVWGPHNIVGHYTKASNISTGVAGATTDNTGARMVAIAYVYDLSKRTSVGLTYARLNNDTNANYNLFTSAALGSSDAITAAGESPRMLQATVRHFF